MGQGFAGDCSEWAARRSCYVGLAIQGQKGIDTHCESHKLLITIEVRVVRGRKECKKL